MRNFSGAAIFGLFNVPLLPSFLKMLDWYLDDDEVVIYCSYQFISFNLP